MKLSQCDYVRLKKLEISRISAMTFSDVVEAIKSLSTDEKQEIQLLVAQYLREERREEMLNNFNTSKEEERSGKLNFSSNISELKKKYLIAKLLWHDWKKN
jgi:hypothetical protein